MNLETIETIVLSNIKYDAYSSLSVDTNAEKILDFATLHYCVHLAREELKLNCMIPAIMKHGTQIQTSVNTRIYTVSDTDVDLVTAVFYTTSSDQFYLERRTRGNILEVVNKISTEGTPNYYIPFGATSAGLAKMELHPVPKVATEYVDFDYKPTLSVLTTSTDEDALMKKYPLTIIKIASAYAFQLLRNDNANYLKWLVSGYKDFTEINLREVGVDVKPEVEVDDLLAQKRSDRYTK